MEDLTDFARVLTVACSIVKDTVGNVLMIEHPDRGWDIPGGKMEKGEDIITCLKREVFEETGTEIEGYKLAGVYQNLTMGAVLFAFISTYVSGKLTASPESLKVEWVKEDECLDRVTHPVVRDRIRDLIEFNGKVLYRSY